MITIYNFCRGIRGVRVAWQCEESGLAYEAVGFDFPVPAEYRAKYPPGSVPFLEDQGGVAIGEPVAQMLYLAGRAMGRLRCCRRTPPAWHGCCKSRSPARHLWAG